MENLARRYPGIAKLETIGHSLLGQPIYAMKVTKNAEKRKDGSRPAVLYSAVQHAREWLAGETERRTLRLFLDNYGKHGHGGRAPMASPSAASPRRSSRSWWTSASSGSS